MMTTRCYSVSSMKCFSSVSAKPIVFRLLLALLTITKGPTMAAPEDCNALRVNNKNCDQMTVPVGYELNAYCINNTTVHISYSPPSSDAIGYIIEMVTMQYTCYTGTENYTVSVAFNSEVLEDSYDETDQLFFTADYCVFTGCTKPERTQCWQYISSSVNIANCASGSHQPKGIIDESSSLVKQSPPATSILATPSSGLVQHISSSAWLTVSHSIPVVSVVSSSLPTLISTVSQRDFRAGNTYASNEGGSASSQLVASVQLTDQSSGSSSSLTLSNQTMPIFFAIAAGLLLIALLAALLIVVMCKRYSKRVNPSGHSTNSGIQAIHETNNNVYMDDSNMFNILQFEPVTGSVLTLVQPLHLDDMITDYNNHQPHPPARPSSLYTSTSNVANSLRSADKCAVTDCKTMFNHSHMKPDSYATNSGDIFHLGPVLNNSCPNIPDNCSYTKQLLRSPQHSNVPLSIALQPPYANTIPTDDAVSCDSIHSDQQTECQLNDAVFSDGIESDSVAPCLPHKPALLPCSGKNGGPSVSSSASHCTSTSSSGYVSTSPVVNGLQQEFCFNRDYIVDYRTSA